MTARSAPDPPFGAPLVVPATAVPGVNLVGFLGGGLGLGEVARKLARALERAGIPFAPIPYLRTPTAPTQPLGREPACEASYDTNIVCVNADYLHTFHGDAGVDFFAGRSTIGVWFWESSVFRADDLAALRLVDEVWVASEYVRRTIAAATDVPIHVVPLPIEEPSVPAKTRADLELPDGFMFLFLFDFVSAQRKNPLAVVEAFKLAFEPGEGPLLVMKGMNGRQRKPHVLGELEAAAEGRPDVHVVDEVFSPEDRDALIASCDCYVSLHRSEGFGLTIAEAMAHGKPVIATAYSGNLDYTTDDTGYPVPYRLVPVPTDWWAHAPGAEWAEPSIVAAAATMREVFDDPTAARARGERGRDAVLSAFSLDRTAAFVGDRVSEVRHRDGRTSGRLDVLRASHALSSGIGGGLVTGGRRQRVARSLLQRALWPYLEEQHRLNSTLLDSLLALQRSVDELSARLAELEDGRNPCGSPWPTARGRGDRRDADLG